MVVSQSDEYGGKTLKKIKSWSVVPGVFVQSDPLHDATGYDLLGDGFGLVDKSPERWQNLVKKLKQLNEESDEHTTYKLIYYARHGEGFHNRAESKYGTAAWDSHWAQKTGDGESVWGPDPLLTEKGIGQARTMNSALKKELEHGMPLPQKLYSSPFQRSATTLQITWEDILLNKGMVPKGTSMRSYLRSAESSIRHRKGLSWMDL
ncbi:hypothetical protein BD324DRAFT_256318 [Kockovaella imperatae]|uniref:Histidine phosphatase superfamily n=1 Tax=Kockovaella imperatae TaxID=4999 RepID=A0A1Y1UPY7_9TREE|nr:hypothetical protein BD324DRAFT_256318 [Kockovaella imperatae]ORX40083.1 hypothetical protein BD324DRAFT_256318 [Kockovaella imperatae]